MKTIIQLGRAGVLTAFLAMSAFATPSFAQDKPAPATGAENVAPATKPEKKRMTREERVQRMIARFDANGDGKITPEEFTKAADTAFAALDTDGDGQVTKEEFAKRAEAMKAARKSWTAARRSDAADQDQKKAQFEALRAFPGWRARMFERADADKSGGLSRKEMEDRAAAYFKRHDRNGDGVLDASDFARKS
ncbi:hypothetical protein BTR14_17655 [Rhizobium rhizosphaerae]|uniref:EF-hand domain-containing protein n=1 Tax=Xaviernesmea rhizosphaerae TaxID=1672749 RepID=A0ABX3PAN6_9HYPH|nr:EF-hand domain-containing protein [Xaviernesmea rhizosphaerae]OQP84929.1 hypothetical protein BTR14_17655 [Xaviernesmea rhizosphaerae]